MADDQPQEKSVADAANEEMIKRASLLIRAYEVAGGQQNEDAIKKAFNHTLPGLNKRTPGQVHIPSNSGATLGFGHDIGQASKAEIDKFYGPTYVGSGGGANDYGPQGEVLTKAERDTLKDLAEIGNIPKKKRKQALKATEGIDLTYDEATKVFEKNLLMTKGVYAARENFPGFDNLPALQQAAIVDRVYMRGPGVSKAEKRLGGEKMLADLKQAVFEGNTKEVYIALKNMERLHKKSKKASSTQGRARARTALAYEGYLQTTQITHH